MRAGLSVAILPLAVAETLCWSAIYYLFPALLPVWEAEMGWSRAEVSGALTAALLVAAVFAPFAGRVIDRGHSRVMFLIAIAVAAVLLGLLSLVQTLWQFWAVWILLGAVNAFVLYEACFAIITVTVGARSKQAITVVTLVAGFAGTISFPTLFVLAETLGWRGAVATFAGVLAFITLPLAFWGMRLLEGFAEPVETKPVRTGTEGRDALHNPVFWLLALCWAATSLLHGMVISHIRPILEDRSVAEATAVIVASSVGPMQVAGRILMVSLGSRITTTGSGLMSFGGMILGAALLLGAGVEPLLAIVFVVPYGMAYGIVSIVRPVIAAEFLGRGGFGTVSGMLAVPYVLGMAIGPLMAAILWDIGGYDLVLSFGLAFVAIGLVGLVVASRLTRRA